MLIKKITTLESSHVQVALATWFNFIVTSLYAIQNSWTLTKPPNATFGRKHGLNRPY